MIVLHIEALATIALCLSAFMAGAWLVQSRTGNSGWVNTIWTFRLGLVGAGSALWPISGVAPNPRQWLVAALAAIWSLIPPLEQQMLRSRGARYRGYQSRTCAFFPLPPHEGVVT
jgi:steroid 5-alpha reductase family enzyme